MAPFRRFSTPDVLVALAILAFAAITFDQTFRIETLFTSSVGPHVWPRIVSVALGILAVIYLVTSLKDARADEARRRISLHDAIGAHRNPLVVLAIFLVFLLTIDLLGMAIGLVLFAFSTMLAIGNRDPGTLVLNALTTIVFVGGMIALFTYGLLVLFPEGEIVRLR